MQRHFHHHAGHREGFETHFRLMGHRHGGGFGHFHGFMGGRGMGGGAFRAGRRLASGDLQLVLLALLAEQSRHGYELIKALEERSEGFYTPSPGMVYPALTWLEEMGYASVSPEGAKKRYGITEAGSAYLSENRAAADAMLSQIARAGRTMGRVREALGALEEDEQSGWPELSAVRETLAQALREKRHSSAEEKRRIVEILKEAVVQIRAKT